MDKTQHLFDPLTEQDKKFIEQTARNVAENAVTLIRGEKGYLPLDPAKSKKILLVS